MNKEVYIRMREGDKESELKLGEVSEEHQLILIDGMLKFFDLDVDFNEMIDVYHRSGKAYREFFDSIEEGNTSEPADSNPSVEDEQVDQDSVVNISDHYTTGIKKDAYDRPLYKCRYKCTECKMESNHYIRPGTKHIKCYGCHKAMRVRPATKFGDPEVGDVPDMHRDSNGNFYIAGGFELDTKTLIESKRESQEE